MARPKCGGRMGLVVVILVVTGDGGDLRALARTVPDVEVADLG